MAALTVLHGDLRGDCYPLGRRTSVVGRAESLPIQIVDNLISRKHLQVRFDHATNRYLALDMTSKNGVFVNGAKISGETVLTHRDRIRIGNTLLLFTERETAESTAVLHRFNQPGQRRLPTHTDLRICPSQAGVERLPAVGRNSRGELVAL